MTDLRVDYYRLENSERDLATLKYEFGALEDRRDRTEDIWGHSDIRDAIDEVASNWKDNREKLIGRLEDVGTKLESVLDTFKQTDADLAASFDQAPDAKQQRDAL